MSEPTLPVTPTLPGDWVPTATDTPFARVGGRDAVHALAMRFYDAMERTEPALTAVHARDAEGRITRETREHFASFLNLWLGGPDDYMQQRGHPRLRMRHGHLRIGQQLRDAWLRCMGLALDGVPLDPPVRRWLDQRFASVADHLRNVPT